MVARPKNFGLSHKTALAYQSKGERIVNKKTHSQNAILFGIMDSNPNFAGIHLCEIFAVLPVFVVT